MPDMQTVSFITHPDVVIDPAVPVPDWPLSPRGRARMQRALMLPFVARVRSIWCSEERKAVDGAEILGVHLQVAVTRLAALGENDRSATGYLPRAEFETVANAFFAQPEQSARGWERAIDAQRRIVAAADHVIAASAAAGGDIAIISHGGVGALLLCHLLGQPISRAFDQPATNGGNMFTFDAGTHRVHHGWQPIDP
jgi:broad specificity phosphatase PhoE